MLSKVLIAAVIFFFLVLSIVVFLKRNYKISYDRKVILSSFLFFVAACAIWWMPNIAQTAGPGVDFHSKIAWIILITLGTNAIITLIFWSIYTVITQNNIIKMPRFIFNILALVILVSVFLFSIKYYFEVSLSGLLVTSTVLSAIIGLSLQDTLTNLFAGVSLQIESPFTIDDWVNLGGHQGKVVSQNWRSLTLLTREHHRITLPNKYAAEEKIINYSRPTPRQIHSFKVDLDYSHPPNLVKSILSDLIHDIQEIEIDHSVYPFIEAYADSGITYCLRFWVDDYSDVLIIQDKVLSRLWYALERNKIKIPYPHTEVRLDVQSPEELQRRVDVQKEYVLNQLKNQSWLSEMGESQLKLLADNSKVERYATHENLVSEGLEGDSMFVVLTGMAKVLVTGEIGREIDVATKSEGEFFGEMSLLTGEPRTATVRAKTDMEVIVIDKKAFVDILLKDSKILEILVNVLETNQSSLTNIIDEERKNSNLTKKSAKGIIMNRIKSYLGIED